MTRPWSQPLVGLHDRHMKKLHADAVDDHCDSSQGRGARTGSSTRRSSTPRAPRPQAWHVLAPVLLAASAELHVARSERSFAKTTGTPMICLECTNATLQARAFACSTFGPVHPRSRVSWKRSSHCSKCFRSKVWRLCNARCARSGVALVPGHRQRRPAPEGGQLRQVLRPVDPATSLNIGPRMSSSATTRVPQAPARRRSQFNRVTIARSRPRRALAPRRVG